MKEKKENFCTCDECIVKMIKTGESTVGFMGWSLWYNRDFEKLNRFVKRRLGRWQLNHLADDVSQDAFLTGWDNIMSGRFEYTGRPLLAYLFGIAKNLIRGRVKKSARENNPISEGYESTCQILSPEQSAIIQEHIEYILIGFEALKPNQQSVLYSTYAQGKNSKEVGSELGTSQENARIIAMRGVQSIQRKIGQVYGVELSAAAVRTGLEFVPAVL